MGEELDFAARQWRLNRMKVLGFRFCTVSPEAPKLASFLDAIGFERHPLEGGGESQGAVFAAGDSWLAMWPPSEEMSAGMMLQVVVDDADAFAARAREAGLSPVGPSDSKSKRIYFLQAPTGLQMSIQSRLPGQESSISAPPPAPVRARSLPVPPPGPRMNSAPAPSAAPAQMKTAPAPSAASARIKNAPAPSTTAARMNSAPAPSTAPARTNNASAPPPVPGRTKSAPASPAAPGRAWKLPPPPPVPGATRRYSR